MLQDDRMTPFDFRQLLGMLGLSEEMVLGIPMLLLFAPSEKDKFKIEKFGKILSTPIGVAAGPHTQMAPNIVSAWFCGARYIELKTVQVLDDIEVSKPCIDLQDIGYNCEWSQELSLEQSFDEYLKAWVIIHYLHSMLEMEGDVGTIFNMCVGYDLAGIQSKPVSTFIAKMRDASTEIERIKEQYAKFQPILKDIDIPSQISDNVTLSTMHGCPPDEIERIGKYLINDLKLHTTIKLNPTLLGPEILREILNEVHLHNIEVPDIAFEHDLKYKDAVSIIKSLTECAEQNGVDFALKLTNTLEVRNTRDVFAKENEMAYMSGRALHPIAVTLAHRLQTDFDGELDISFCAGVDAFNVVDLLKCNLAPITVCSDLLKPGGYGRLAQYIEEISIELEEAESLEDLISGEQNDPLSTVEKDALYNLGKYSERLMENLRYTEQFPLPDIKTNRRLGYFDCIAAPCKTQCATEQNIPYYMYLSRCGEFSYAFDVVMKTNPLPFTTGMVCNQLCAQKCTRINYDSAVQIRGMKHYIASGVVDKMILPPEGNIGKKVAIIGAGASGLSCAFYLRLYGFEVEIYEERAKAGGMIDATIPKFRLPDEDLEADIKEIVKLGVKIHYNHKVTADEFIRLRRDFDYVYIAVGAWIPRELGFEQTEGVYNHIDFLSRVKAGEKVDIGKQIAVIGGGNSAMDAARVAKKIAGADAKVTILYRRDLKDMPASPEEIEEAIAEDVELMVFVSPEKAEKREKVCLSCFLNQPGEADESGRAKPVRIEDSEFEMEFDTVITAIGQRVNLDFIESKDFKPNVLTCETGMDNVYVGGDALLGPATIVQAIGCGRFVAEKIISKENIELLDLAEGDYQISQAEHVLMRSYRDSGLLHDFQESGLVSFYEPPQNDEEAMEEASRCMICDDYCGICATVCPNRANMVLNFEPTKIELQDKIKVKPNDLNDYEGLVDIVPQKLEINQPYQIINIGDLCNECGNCETFCPTTGAPYKDKPRFYINKEAFANASRGHIIHFYKKSMVIRSRETGSNLKIAGKDFIYDSVRFNAVFSETIDDPFMLYDLVLKAPIDGAVDLTEAVVMKVLFDMMLPIYKTLGQAKASSEE